MDSDGVADASDNCPATVNANQSDADVNGVGDACQGKGLATGDSLAYQSDAGVAEARFDERLRSVQIASPGQVATLVWPADSSHVDIELVINKIRTTSSTPVDFSDAALLEALDDAEDEGADVAVYRQYIADHPGQILQIVTGQQHPSSASKQGWLEQQQQVIYPGVDKYLLRLRQAVIICRATAMAFKSQLDQTEDPQLQEHYFALVKHFANLAREIDDVYDNQERECITCTDNCNVPCEVPPEVYEHACCIYNFEANQADCVETYLDDCTNNWHGEFHEDFTCEEMNDCDTGACCMDIDDLNPEPPDFNQLPRCAAPVTHKACDETAGEQAGIIMRTKFHIGKTCDDIICVE